MPAVCRASRSRRPQVDRDRLRRAVAGDEAAAESLRGDGSRAAADERVDHERARVGRRGDHALEQRQRLLRRVAGALARGGRDARDVPDGVERLAALEVVAPPVGVLVAAVLVGRGRTSRPWPASRSPRRRWNVLPGPAGVEQQHVVLARERVGRRAAAEPVAPDDLVAKAVAPEHRVERDARVRAHAVIEVQEERARRRQDAVQLDEMRLEPGAVGRRGRRGGRRSGARAGPPRPRTCPVANGGSA